MTARERGIAMILRCFERQQPDEPADKPHTTRVNEAPDSGLMVPEVWSGPRA